MTNKNNKLSQFTPQYTNKDMAFYDDVRELPFTKEELILDTNMILLCEEGKFQIEIENKLYHVSKNNILICAPNYRLSNCMLSTQCRCKIFTFSSAIIRDSVTESHLWEKIFSLVENPIISFVEEDMPKLHLYRDLMFIKTKEEKNYMNREIINSLVRAMFYEILQKVEGAGEVYGKHLTSRKEMLFKSFIEMLSSLPVRPRQIDWYADRLCVTSKYLSFVCKSVSGKTTSAWIREYVQKDINYQLKNSNKSIKEIADYLQFPNLSFFGKYIRGYTGMSPKEYRKYLRTES